MRIRLLLALAVFASLSVLIVLLAAGPALGQTDPPASGDWTVADTTVVMDQTVNLHGDLLVTDTGRLTLENVTLRIHLSSNGEYGIEVMGDGSLTIKDGDDDKATTSDASRVTAVPTSRSYYMIANTGSVLRLTNSFITRCGHTGMAGATHQGIYIATDDAIIRGMTVDDCLQGLVVEDGSVTVSESSFTNSTYHGITTTNSDLDVGSTTLADNGYEGARIVGGTAMLDMCYVITNRNGIVARTSAVVTISDTLVKGNADGILAQQSADVTIDGCTVAGQTNYGIHAENMGELTVTDTVVYGTTRSGLYANNDITVFSTGSTYRNNVYGVRLNMNCRMTSVDDTYRANSNSGIFLETTSRIVIAGSDLLSNSVGIKGEGSSSVLAWSPTVSDCFFEGFKLTDTDLELNDGTVANCTGGGIVLDTASTAVWTVNAGNSSVLLNADVALTDDMVVRGDLQLSKAIITFKTGASLHTGIVCEGGTQDWQNVTLRPSDPSQGCKVVVKGTATGMAWYLTVENAGWATTTMESSGALFSVPFDLHRCTFKDGVRGLVISGSDTVVDVCTFSDNDLGALVDGATVSFENCTFSGNVGDLQVQNGADAALVNSTFNSALVTVSDGTSRWSSWWIVHIDVSFPSGHVAPGAQVEIVDALGTTVFQGTTGSNGHIAEVLVLEHVTTTTGRDARTPHTFKAVYGVSLNETAVAVDRHMTVEMKLDDMDGPALVVTSHTDGDHIPTGHLVLRGTATDTGSSVFRVEGRLGTGAWSTATGTDSWEWTYDLPGDGTYPITVRARDYALNEASVTLNITMDTRGPVIMIEVPPTPANNSLVGTRDIIIKGYADKAATVITAGNVTATMDGVYFTLNITLEEGPNVIVIRAVDLAGNWVVAEWHLEADLEAPPLTVISPVDGLLINVTSVTLEGETGPFIDVYYRLVDYTTSWTLVSVSPSGLFTHVVTDLFQGPNRLEVMAKDVADNRAIVTILINVDTIAPNLVSVLPEDGRYVRFSWLGLNGTMSEPVVTVGVDSREWDADGANFSINIPLDEGPNYIQLDARDLAGNTGHITLVYRLDTQAPTLEIPSLTWNVSKDKYNPFFTNNAFPDLPGRTELGSIVYVDGWDFTVDEQGHFVANLELEEGTSEKEILVRDLAGNELRRTIVMVLDTVAPFLEVHEPAHMTRTDKDFIFVRGTITPGDTVSVGTHSIVSEDGNFDLKVRLDQSVNRVIVTASDEAGNEVFVTRLVFMYESTEGVTGVEFLDANCTSLLVVGFIIIITLGIITSFMWKGTDVDERKEKALQQVMEEDHIELDKPHLEPTTGYLQYDSQSPTGRKPEFEEKDDDEEFVSMADFKRQMQGGGDDGSQ